MKTKLEEVLSGQRDISLEEVEEWAKEYPYFVVPKVSALRSISDMQPGVRQQMLAQVAVCVGDREELATILGDDLLSYAEFYPDSSKPAPTTTSVIDSFLDTYAPADSKETELLSKVLFSNTPDYASEFVRQMTADDDGRPSAHLSEEDKMIDRFLAGDKAASVETKAEDSEKSEEGDKSEKSTNSEISAKSVLQEPENTSLTESFARVMIKNGNYRKALQIITDLSLNNPEKSIYFADQIRFLKKLIINENN